MITDKKLLLFPFILLFYEMISYLSNDMYLPALPIIAKDFNVSTQATQWTLTLWFLGSATLHLILGPISDRFGRRPILIFGNILLTISTVLCAMAPTIEVFLTARFLQGCSVCFIGTAGYSSIHECFSQIKAIQILALMGSIVIIAPAFGPLMGALILHKLSWRMIFGILAALSIVSAILLWGLMPESLAKEKRQSIHWALAFKQYRAIILNPAFMFNVLVFGFTFLGMIAWIAAGPFLVINQFHFNTIYFGIFQAMIFFGLVLGSQIVKYWVESIGTNKLVQMGLTITLASSTLACCIGFLFPKALWGLILSLMLFTFGSSLAFSPSARTAIESCESPMGIRMAVFSTLLSFSAFIGGALVSMTYNGTLAWMGSLMLIVSISAVFCKIKAPQSLGVIE